MPVHGEKAKALAIFPPREASAYQCGDGVGSQLLLSAIQQLEQESPFQALFVTAQTEMAKANQLTNADLSQACSCECAFRSTLDELQQLDRYARDVRLYIPANYCRMTDAMNHALSTTTSVDTSGLKAFIEVFSLNATANAVSIHSSVNV